MQIGNQKFKLFCEYCNVDDTICYVYISLFFREKRQVKTQGNIVIQENLNYIKIRIILILD